MNNKVLHNLKRTFNIASILNSWPTPIRTNNFLQTKLPLNRFCGTSSTILQPVKCWNCGTEKASSDIQFKCTKCENLLDLPDDVNYFHLLSLDKKFSIDTAALTNKFRQLQNVLHPDKFSNKSEKEQNLSAEWSSLVNKAYKILLSPIQRAEYLLKSYNVEIPEGNTATNTEFLMEMMERNEEVAEAETKEDLQRLLENVRTDCKKCVDKLETSLANGDLVEAKAQVIVLRYFLSLENSIKERGNRIGIIV